jgi:hypothetical protein
MLGHSLVDLLEEFGEKKRKTLILTLFLSSSYFLHHLCLSKKGKKSTPSSNSS